MELLVDDLILVDDTFLGKKKYFMISESRDKFIRLNKEQYEFYSQLIHCIGKSSNTRELDNELKEISKGKISYDDILPILKKYNLLTYSLTQEKRKIEAELSSIKLKEYRLDLFQDKYSIFMKYMWYVMNCVLIAMIVYIVCNLIFNHDIFQVSVGLANSSMNAVKNGSINIIVLVFGSFFALVGHEIGHLLSANHNRVGWKSVNFILKFGLMFSCYIRYKNFHAHTSKVKIKVLLAGIYMNFFQCCLWLILFMHFKEFNYIALVAMNVLCILNNIQPKGTSDGYQLISIVFGVEGIRWRMLKVVSSIVKNPTLIRKVICNKKYIFFIMYFLISYGLSIWTCIILFLNTMDYIKAVSDPRYIIWLLGLVSISMITLFMNNVIRFIKNLKTF